MTRSWLGTHEASHLSGELATSTGRDFERLCIPLLRLIWRDTITPPALGSFDRVGVDHIVWSDVGRFSLVVQCKGFLVSEQQVSVSQIKQCCDSIKAFRDSGISARCYLLVHNRDGRNKEFRRDVETELNRLTSSGQVEQAYLWDRQTFLKQAFQKMYTLVQDAAKIQGLSKLNDQELYEPELCPALEQVPLRSSLLSLNRQHLVGVGSPREEVSDPVNSVLACTTSNITVLIGEAGFGKTTTVRRAAREPSNNIVYVRAADIASDTTSTKDLLIQCIDIDHLLHGFEPTDIPMLKRVLRPAWERLLKEPDTPVRLVLDGIDESIYFARRGGLQQLFNSFLLIRVPIIFTPAFPS